MKEAAGFGILRPGAELGVPCAYSSAAPAVLAGILGNARGWQRSCSPSQGPQRLDLRTSALHSQEEEDSHISAAPVAKLPHRECSFQDL